MTVEGNSKQAADRKDVDFTNRNDVERFLDGGQFRRCANLKCESVRLAHQTLFMPVCHEGRFDKKGVAESIAMPEPPRPLSPMTYTTVGIWAPLVSCPRDCNGFKSRLVASAFRVISAVVRWVFGKQQVQEDLATTRQERKWWERPLGIVVLGVVVAVVGGLIVWAISRRYDTPKASPNIEETKVPLQLNIPIQPSTSGLSVRKPTRSKPKTAVDEKKAGKPEDDKAIGSGNITTGPCSNVQIGGSSNQATINCGTPPPAPLEMKWRVSDEAGDQTRPYAKIVTVTVNVSFTPVAIGVQCDAPIEEISFTKHKGMVALNSRTFSEGNVAFVYFEGTSLTANDELYISLKSSRPFSVLQVGKAMIRGLND